MKHGQSRRLEQLVLESHVRLGLKTDAGTEDVGQSSALLSQSIDDGSAGRGQGGLEHVAQDAQDAVEVLVLGRGRTISGGGLPLDTGHHLGNDHKINDQGRSQERVLANVEETILELVVYDTRQKRL